MSLKGESLDFINVAKETPQALGAENMYYIILWMVISQLMRDDSLKYTVYLHLKYEAVLISKEWFQGGRLVLMLTDVCVD